MTCNIECQYLRPVKAEKLYDAFNKTEYRRGLTSEEYIKATILPVRREECGKPDLGGAVDRNGEYIISSVTPGWASGWYDDYQCTYCEYTAVYCGRMIGHWGHFLLESITRLWFFLEHDDPSYTYVFIVDEGTSPPIIGNFRQFFELLGIIDRLVFLNKPTQYNKVIIPGRSFQSNRFYYQEYSDILDRVIYNSYRTVTACSLEKRIFLSRRYFDRAVKSEVGLEMLDSFFSRNGYKIIYPEKISLSELIVLIGNSDECASESGSCAHNFLFCPYGHKTMIMERHTVVNKAQTSIDIVRRLKTVYVDSQLDIVPVYSGAGPFFLYFTPCMEKLAEDLNYLPPADEFTGRAYLKNGLDTYKQMYREIYKDAIPDCKIFDQYKNELTEAENESNQILSEFGLY